MEAEPAVEGYLRRCGLYWHQARELLEAGQIEKASELAWGSVVEKVKALALARTGVELQSHRQLRDYIKRVAGQIHDEELYRAYREAEGLHINFYESWHDLDDVRQSFVAIEGLLAKIDGYLRL